MWRNAGGYRADQAGSWLRFLLYSENKGIPGKNHPKPGKTMLICGKTWIRKELGAGPQPLTTS